MCAFFVPNFDHWKADHDGELERVSWELNHPWALPYLHKQVNYIINQIYLSNRSNRSNISNISKTSNIFTMLNIHKQEQSWQGCLVLHCLHQPWQILAKKIQVLTCKKNYAQNIKLWRICVKFFLFMKMSFCLSEFDLSTKSTYIFWDLLTILSN